MELPQKGEWLNRESAQGFHMTNCLKGAGPLYPIPENEFERIAALRNLEIVGTARQPEFDDLVELACEMFDVPVSLLSLVDSDRQWFKAAAGLDIQETDRDVAFCNYTIAASEPLVVDDASLDPRFSCNPLVVADPSIRFYAGVPLALHPGVNLGTLCVVDFKPRVFSGREIEKLRKLGNVAQALLREHSANMENLRHTKLLRKQASLMDMAQDLAKLGAWERDLQSGQIEWTDGMFAIHEMEPGRLIGFEELMGCYLEPDRSKLTALMETSMRDCTPYVFEGRIQTARGNVKWIRLASEVHVENGKVVRRFGMKQDITEQKALSDRVLQIAYTDELTGLANRRALRERLLRLGSYNEPLDAPIVLASLDIDNFRDVNDAYGHAAGDACLKRVARRLKFATGKDRFLYRIGADRFALLKYGSNAVADAAGNAWLIQNAISKPIKWRGHSFRLTASIGYSWVKAGDVVRTDDLTSEAHLAMCAAKGAGGNCFRAYDPEFGLSVAERIGTLDEMRTALAESRLELYYQPKVRMADGAITGFECLLRMNKADGGVLAPGAFAAALEDAVLSKEIGDFVVASALNQCRDWQNTGVHFGSVAINLSASQFREPMFSEDFLTAIKARGLSPSVIEVEVTEGIFLSANSNTVLKACKRLHDGGVRIAFDDFGTGFASLTHLRDFPVDILKIDRSFITDLEKGGNATAIVNAMTSLARNMSMTVVAEGVETQAQADFLAAIGCDQAQGYLYSRPVQAHVAAKLIESQDNISAEVA